MLFSARRLYDCGFRLTALGDDFDEFERPLPEGGVLLLRVGLTSFELTGPQGRVGGGRSTVALYRCLAGLD